MGKGPIRFSALVGEVVDVTPLVVEWVKIGRTELVWAVGRKIYNSLITHTSYPSLLTSPALKCHGWISTST